MLTVSAGLLASGCITHEETVYKDVPRAKVEFENDTAGRIFYEALSNMKSPGREESRTEVDIPVVFEHKHRVMSGGANMTFNDAVRECDTNQDAKITEQEARIFAERKHH